MLRFSILLIALVLLTVSIADSQQVQKKPNPPRYEAVAETALLMEGLLQPNFKGAEKILRGVPKDVDAWTFTRGQALLMAETGNLLLLRPPREKGQETWVTRSIEMREAATKLARFAAEKDLVRARSALSDLADVCNRCHDSFRVRTRITLFAKEGE